VAHGTAWPRRRRGVSSGRPRHVRRKTAPRGEVEKRREDPGAGRRLWPGRAARDRRRDGDERPGDGVATGKEEMVARAVL